MSNRTVTLIRNCKTPNGWKRFPVVFSKNGRIKPNVVLVDGSECNYPEGVYQLRSYIGKAPQYVSVGKNAATALNALVKASRVSEIKADAANEGIQIVPEDGRKRLATELRGFRDSALDRGSAVAEDVYRLACDDFLTHCGKEYVDEVTTEDVSKWHGAMRRRGLSDRTVYNRHTSVKSFLKYLDIVKIAPRNPRFEKTLPEIYSEKEMERFFAAVHDDFYQTVVFSIMLMAGLRMREVMHLEWTDIDWEQKTLRVQSKPKWDHKVKDKEERDVPIPAPLLALLKKWRKEQPNHKLVVGTKTDKPNRKLLRTLKRTVYASGLNCGTCDGCRSDLHECAHWWLHKFRATYITRLIRAGIDLRTVMSLSGHSDLASVMRYLRPAEGEHLRARVNAAFSA
jgi:integrase